MSPNTEQGEDKLAATRFYYRSEISKYTQEVPNTITMDYMDKAHISDCSEILKYTQEITTTVTMDNMDKKCNSDCNANT